MLNNNFTQSSYENNFDKLLALCTQNLQDSNMIGSTRMLSMLRNADYGFVQNGPTQISSFNFNNIQEYINQLIINNNQAENVRNSNMKFDEDFIVYAKMKGNRDG